MIESCETAATCRKKQRRGKDGAPIALASTRLESGKDQGTHSRVLRTRLSNE